MRLITSQHRHRRALTDVYSIPEGEIGNVLFGPSQCVHNVRGFSSLFSNRHSMVIAGVCDDRLNGTGRHPAMFTMSRRRNRRATALISS